MAFRQQVAAEGLEAAYASTDVVVASTAEFTDQASLVLNLGPSDPPIRIRRFQLDGVGGWGGHGSTDLVVPIGGGLVDPLRRGGAQVLAALLAGQALDLSASGDATALHPRRELESQLDLDRIGSGRLLLHRGIVENGLVAVSSAEGLTPSPYGPLLGPYGTALYSCSGAASIGLTMPGLALLGPGSPVLVAGALGWVSGPGSGHQPHPRRLASGHARSPGAVAALTVEVQGLRPQWLRACFFEGHGSALLVAIAAPVPLINLEVARQAAVPDSALEAPVLDFSIPRRIRPSFGAVSYSQLLAGQIQVEGQSLSCAPAHSPRLAASIAEELVSQLQEGRFPLRLPLVPLANRPALVPLEG
ncbi:MAG: homocysteine biosynthesis protein [Synechococcus sp. ELA619]